MKHIRIALPLTLTLTLLLAACGGDGPTPTPPTPPVEQPPAPPVVTPPVTPAPPVTPLPPTDPTPPTSDLPYYGEWIVTFTTDSGVSFFHSLNITEAAPAGGWENGGYGLQTLCLDEATPCRGASDYSSSGYGYIGNFELSDGSAPLDMTLFTQYDPEDESELKITTSGSGLTLSSDAQGRETLEGSAVWFYSGDSGSSDGSIYAVNIGAPRSLSGLGNVQQSDSIKQKFSQTN